MLNVYEQVDQNRRKSLLVILGFFCFIVLAIWIFGRAVDNGYYWLGPGLIIAGISSLSGFYWSDKIILALSGARPANRQQDFNFYTVTENLCLAAQLPMPKLYVIESQALNAFACGRDENHATVCATTGLLEKLDRSELEGVIAHELSHIKNYDMRLMTIVAIFVGLIALISDWFVRGRLFWGRKKEDKGQIQGIIMILAIVLAFLAPLIANLIKLAISRRREFLADAGSAMLTRYPQGLARALEKISADHHPLETASNATAHLYITNPFKKGKQYMSKIASLFNTHPPIEERIKALNRSI